MSLFCPEMSDGAKNQTVAIFLFILDSNFQVDYRLSFKSKIIDQFL
jgi:hypothetical protein